jgi:hypothetical protein
VEVGSPADVTFTFSADTGYHVSDVIVDGTSVGAPASYTFADMDANHTIRVNFAVNEYAITATAGPNGSIWWSNVQNPQPPLTVQPTALVQHAVEMQTFVPVPDTGYQVADVLVDGVSQGPLDYYTFANVVAPRTIHVIFELQTYTITPSASAGGTITPSTPQSVTAFTDSPAFTIAANPGFHLTELKIDGVIVPMTNTYTFTNVQQDHTIAATFTSDAMLPVYRFINLQNGAHFYTASAAERDTVAVTWPTVWSYEGVAYVINLDNPANSSPLFRFYNRVSGSHFYTVSAAERDHVIATWPNVFTYEGEAYNVSATAAANTMPVFRFYNVTNGAHFYTASVAERDTVLATWPNIFAYEGPAFYIGY